MAKYRGFRSLKCPVKFPRWQAKSWIAAVFFFVIVSQVVYKIGDNILDQMAYPYNMYKGYPLSIYDNPYSINTNRTCFSSRINMIVVIHSKVTNFMKREAIRRSWANRHLLSGYGMKVVFFLGLPFHDDIQALIHQESLDYNDIVQGTFYDAYTNITHKAVLWMRWVTEYCADAPYVLKLDDDVFVNVFSLYHNFLPNYRNTSMKMWCEIKPAGTQGISRFRTKKWRVASHDLKGHKYYPLTLCRGYFVIMTRDIIGPMYAAAKQTPFFWIDDYYVFGILADKAGVKHSSLLQFLSNHDEALTCFESTTKLCSLLGVLLELQDVGLMGKLWRYTVGNLNTNFQAGLM